MRKPGSAISRQWDPKSLGNCVIHYPFYRYGREVSKIWNQASNAYHGTIIGATPSVRNIISTAEIISNGSFEAGNPPTDWTSYGSPDTFEQSGVQKHSGSNSAHLVELHAAATCFYQTLAAGSRIAGHTYRYSFWYYLVSGKMACSIIKGDNSGTLATTQYTITGSWQYVETELVQDTTDAGSSSFQFWAPTEAGEFYIDEVSIKEVIGSDSTGWYFDGTDDVIKIVNDNSLTLGTSWSFAFWVDVLEFGSAATADRIVNTGDGETAPLWSIELGLSNEASAVSLGIFDNESNIWHKADKAIALTDRYHCIIVTGDGTNIKTYFDDTMPTGGTYASVQAITNTNLNLGASIGGDDTSLSNLLKMRMREFLVFNKALNLQEAKAYYEKTRNIDGI